MDEFTRIKTFIDVVEAGSFSRAAQGMSISAITRRVQSLEDELGVRLLNRNTRGLSLTDAGRQFYERVIGISQRPERRNHRSEVAAARREGPPQGVPASRNGHDDHRAGPAEAPRAVSRPATRNHRDGREARPHCKQHRRRGVARALPNSVIARRLSPNRRVVCGTPAYFDRHGVPLAPSDLKGHNCLLYTPIFVAQLVLRSEWRARGGGGRRQPEFGQRTCPPGRGAGRHRDRRGRSSGWCAISSPRAA